MKSTHPLEELSACGACVNVRRPENKLTDPANRHRFLFKVMKEHAERREVSAKRQLPEQWVDLKGTLF